MIVIVINIVVTLIVSTFTALRALTNTQGLQITEESAVLTMTSANG